jgi:hypothetical protein
MKKSLKLFVLATLLLCFTAIAQTTFAQGPPPPPSGPGAKGSSTNKAPGGGDAPIGNGTFILVALAAAYAGKKAYLVKSEK